MQRSSVYVVVAGIVLAFAGVAHSATLDESIHGDFPATGATPTQWTLEAGDNLLAGSAGTSRTAGADYDLVTLNIPAGLKLVSLLLTKHEIDFGLSFMGWQHGAMWTAGFGNDVDGNQLFRYQLFDSNYIGFDLLFDIDLPGGSYTIELQDIHLPYNYGFTFEVVPVPEPGVVALAAVAACGTLCRRRICGNRRYVSQASGSRSRAIVDDRLPPVRQRPETAILLENRASAGSRPRRCSTSAERVRMLQSALAARAPSTDCHRFRETGRQPDALLLLVARYMSSTSRRALMRLRTISAAWAPKLAPAAGRLALFLALLASDVCRGGFLTDFEASYALYKQCTGTAADFNSDDVISGFDFLQWQRGHGRSGQFLAPVGDADRNGHVNKVDFDLWNDQFGESIAGLPDSVCFALYKEPEGITAGRVTVVLEVPNPLPAQRLIAGPETVVIDADPRYTVSATFPPLIFQPTPGTERLETTVTYNAVNPLNPPTGPVTIFGYQTMDNQPQLGLAGVIARFEFRPGDFITVFDSDTGQSTTFNDTELDDVPLQIFEPLILDVNTVTGAVSIRNPSASPIQINYYEITSFDGGLNPGGWVSIDEGEGGDPPGFGWDEAGGAGVNALAESNIDPMTYLTINGGQSHSLGTAYNFTAGMRDLIFAFGTAQCGYVPGVINFNTTSLSGAVPEPSTCGLAIFCLASVTANRRRASESKSRIAGVCV